MHSDTREKVEEVAGTIQITQRPAHEAKLRSIGGYDISSNREDLDPETLLRTYWRLAEIGQSFWSRKSDFGLWPMYHSKDERIKGHMIISVLVYHVNHLVRTKLKDHESHENWDTLRDHLNRIHRVTTKYYQTKECHILTKIDQDMSPFLERIFEIMGVKYDSKATMSVDAVHLPTRGKYDPETTAFEDDIPLLSEPKKPPDL